MPNPKFHVFLSHNSADKPAVEELARRLKAENIEPWLDKLHLTGGSWMPAIEKALADSASCAVFIGSSGISPWQEEEMWVAINRCVTTGRSADSKDRFRVIPVLLPGAARAERSRLPAFLVNNNWVEFRATLDEPEPFRRLLCYIRGIEPGYAPGETIVEGQCPYRGLEFFDAAHARFFFGREAMTEWLLTALRRTPAGAESRFLAVLGPSGSGKSSLARAGLIPALKAGGLDGSADWPVAVLQPGADPLEALAVALTSLGGVEPTAGAVHALMADLRASDNALHLTARLALRDAPPARRLVLLVDHFEEVFTLCSDDAARKAFIDNLVRAAAASGGRTVVVLAMRADFLGKCATHPALAAALSDHQALVGPMTEDELRRAIERPAQRVGCEVEPGLVDVLIQDVQGQSGALPLMQYALLELWKRRDGRRLTLEAYHAIGGLRGALERRANEVLGQFTEGERELCRRIFLRLTQPGEGTEDTKRRATYRELASVGPGAEAVQEVLRRLADARLITAEGDDKRPGEGTVDVAHEALIRGWPELRKWIDADRAGLRTQRRMTEAAREWEGNGRDASFLYGGARLAVAKEWVGAHGAELNVLETEFLSASVEAEGRRKADEVAEARRRLRLTLALAATLLLAVVGVAAGALWYQDEQNARSTEHAKRAGATERDVTAALEEATAFAKQATGLHDDPARWEAALTEARSAVERAEGVLDSGEGTDELRKRVDAKQKELEAADKDRLMVGRLDELAVEVVEPRPEIGRLRPIRLAVEVVEFRPEIGRPRRRVVAGPHLLSGSPSLDSVTGLRDPEQIDRDYAAVLRDSKMPLDATDPEEMAAWVRASAVRERLVQALDSWVYLKRDANIKEGADLLREAAQLADPNKWRIGLRKLSASDDRKGLEKLAEQNDVLEQPPQALAGLGLALLQARDKAVAVKTLRDGQQRHPSDFGINVLLAAVLDRGTPSEREEAIGFHRAALAIRPRNPRLHDALGNLLFMQGKPDEAAVEYQLAFKLDPKYADAHNNLGNVLAMQGKLDEAQGKPDEAQGKPDEAEAEYRLAIKLDPNYAIAHYNFGVLLDDQDKLDEAAVEYRAAIERHPKEPLVRYNLGVRLAGLGKLDEAAKEYDAAVSLYAEAFAQKPALAADPASGDRYYAACAAVLAGCDQGVGTVKTDEKERGRWRKQALDWLRADLILWTKKIGFGGMEDRDAARQALQDWQTDPALAGVRDQDALAKLPEDEQDAWRKLWADVDACSRRPGRSSIGRAALPASELLFRTAPAGKDRAGLCILRVGGRQQFHHRRSAGPAGRRDDGGMTNGASRERERPETRCGD